MKKIALFGILLSIFCIVNMEAKDKMNALNMKEQKIVAIAACTARGDMPNLKNALSAGRWFDRERDQGNPGSALCLLRIPAQSECARQLYGASQGT